VGAGRSFAAAFLKVGNVGAAEWAADHIQMEAQMFGQPRLRSAEQEGAPFATGRAAEPFTPPYGADTVFSAIQ